MIEICLIASNLFRPSFHNINFITGAAGWYLQAGGNFIYSNSLALTNLEIRLCIFQFCDVALKIKFVWKWHSLKCVTVCKPIKIICCQIGGESFLSNSFYKCKMQHSLKRYRVSNITDPEFYQGQIYPSHNR